MNELLNSFFDNFINYYPSDSQDQLINSLFQQASTSEELTRNEEVKIDIQSKLFVDTEKTFTSCSICSDDYKDEDVVTSLNCNHIFHKNCIEEWGHYNPVCPVCKADAAQIPRIDGPTLNVLRNLTFQMGGADLSTHLERGEECSKVL